MLCSLRELSKTPSSFYGSVTSAVCIVAHKAFTNHVHLSWSAAIVHTSVKSGYSVSWIWWICSASCNNTVLRERVISLQPNPQLGAPGHNTLPGPYPSVLCSAWVSLPGVQNSSRPSSRGHGEANRPTTMRWWSFQDGSTLLSLGFVLPYNLSISKYSHRKGQEKVFHTVHLLNTWTIIAHNFQRKTTTAKQIHSHHKVETTEVSSKLWCCFLYKTAQTTKNIQSN